MVKSNESGYRNPRGVENFSSSFEKNVAISGPKPVTDAGHHFSRNSSAQEPQSPEDLRHMKGHPPVSQFLVAARKNDQWNMKRDIPVGTVRNNAFLPEPKQQPPLSPQLKYLKKQWDTSNIPKGSVAARVQQSNSPRGGNKPVSPSMVKGGTYGRSKAFSHSTSSYIHPQSTESARSNASTPHGFFPKGGNSSSQTRQQSVSQRLNEERDKVASKKGWEPSREIPSGTVKGRLSSLYGGQSTSKGMKVKDKPTHAPVNSNKIGQKPSVEVSRKNTETSNDDEDQWIIPERKGANIQVFDGDWGEAIHAKSAESDDWETPAKDWIRSGESQTEASSCKEAKQNASNKQDPFPAEIAAPMPEEIIPQIGNGIARKSTYESKPKSSASSILPPPPKDASAYHKPKCRESEQDTLFDPRSALSEEFSHNFQSFSTKSEIDSIENFKTRFSSSDRINQQLINGDSDAFGFPLPSTSEVVESQDIGEVVGGDEFFDASALPEDYGQASKNTSAFDASAPFDEYSKPICYDSGFNVPTLRKDFGETTDKSDVNISVQATIVESKSNEEGFAVSSQPNGYGPRRDEQVRNESSTNSYDQPTSPELSYNLDRYPSMSSATSKEDDAFSGMNELISGKGDSKKKKKGFLKGLFGRKSKGNGKVKQSAKDNKIRKDRSVNKTNLSDSMNNSELNTPATTLVNKTERKQVKQVPPTKTIQESNPPSEGQVSNEKSQGDTAIPDRNEPSEFKSRYSSTDDIFDGLEEHDTPSPKETTAIVAEDVFLDPELDHLDSHIDSDEESIQSTAGPQKKDVDAKPGSNTNGKSDIAVETSLSSTIAHPVRLKAPVRSQSLVSSNDSSSRNRSLPKRYTQSSVEWHDGKRAPQGTYGRRYRPARSGYDSQNTRGNVVGSNVYTSSGKKFSRATHAYNSITKKNMSEDTEDQRKYLSIPAASTSASDISCLSTYDSYQKKLLESLQKANIVAKNLSEPSLRSKSLDDSSIESDIRVLRTILHRPRLGYDNDRVIMASRKIQAFPTYDTESATDPMQRLGMRLLSSAIIPIQTEVRRFLATRHALTRMWALITIQTYTRRFLARKKFRKAVTSVITIQSVLRGHLARNDVIDKHICAIEIQRFVRGYLATMQVYEDIYKVTLIQSLVRMRIAMDYAAYRMSLIIQLQAIARGFLERRRLAHRNRCATLIQSSWRCFSNRLNYQFDLLDIIIVQSLWRKKLAVRVAEGKVAKRRNMAATLIQAEWRAYDCRMDFLCYTSARTIQAKWRGYACKRDYLEYQASTIIQSAARMFICRLQYIDYQSAVTIQSLARMYFCRSDYTYYKSARMIQSIGRMYLCRYDYLEYQAATKMQSAVRMFLCRSGYVEYKAATTLQSTVRMFLCRSDYTKYRAEIAATMIQAKWRSYDCSSMYKRYRAATTIQKMWRSYDCQMNFLHFLADILVVQSTIRRFLVQRRVKLMKNGAAVKIQSAWRGLICYIDYHEHLTVRRIQAAWRGYVCRNNYKREKAAILIQSTWRGYVCRKNYKREKAAILIQSTWRGFLFYADYMFELSDIVVVQKQIRVWLAKRVANKRRRSIQIQAQIRGYLQRKDYLSKKLAVSRIETAWLNARANKMASQLSVINDIVITSRDVETKESSAAIKLQQVFRGSLCRNALKVYLAAVLIQSRVRGKQARVAVSLYIAVRKIQAAWRGFVPRQSYKTYIAVRKIQAAWRSYIPRQSFITFIAARRIQNSWRCKKANHEATELRKEYHAAISIQSAWRGFVSYTDYVFTVSDIVAAQRIARGYLSRKKYSGIIRSNVGKTKDRKNSAVAIQRIFRGFQARQDYWYALGCTMQIQSWWRGRLVILRIKKEANAVCTLQCFARCCLARQEYMQRRFVLMLIQTAELERTKKVKGLKVKEQRREDMEKQEKDEAARVIQRFFSDVDHEQASQLVLATKRRKEWRENLKKGKDINDMEETMLEDIWTGVVSKSDFVEEPFTRHYDDFSKLAGPAMPSSSHPTSSIRMIRKVDQVDINDDFKLEEAFIDAEICHAKERRLFAGSDRLATKMRPGKLPTKDRRVIAVSAVKTKRTPSIGRDRNKSRGNPLAMMSNH